MGLNAVDYHIVNVLLHAVNAILLWRLLARLMPNSLIALAVSERGNCNDTMLRTITTTYHSIRLHPRDERKHVTLQAERYVVAQFGNR
jgi:hypothetical protein